MFKQHVASDCCNNSVVCFLHLATELLMCILTCMLLLELDIVFFKTFSNEVLSIYRTEASRLSEENLILRQKLAALKEEDLKETQEELM